ncbi:class A beta-lactamase (plasmid) [Streptomyces sp. BI20]|uniref:class A beta-lactamase n=1 Tax=Streptomyces sp. BI20 TaxID=3403460 RepID=UPI003C75BC0F
MRGVRARRVLAGVCGVLLVLPVAACGRQGAHPAGDPPASASPRPGTSASSASAPTTERLRALERTYGARLGVYALDTGDGRVVAHREGERFAYASTFKAFVAGAVLRRHGVAALERVVRYGEKDLLPNSPVSERHVATGMTLAELCDAAVRHSDNTAANLLLDEVGGPKGLEGVLRSVGDTETVMERREPELNRWEPGRVGDTTTPRAFAGALRAFVLGDALREPERARLTTWLRTNLTGNDVIRAGVPKGWTVGDKTGTGGRYGIRNDIAVLWPPGRAPIVLAVLTDRPGRADEPDDRLLADAAAAVVADLS